MQPGHQSQQGEETCPEAAWENSDTGKQNVGLMASCALFTPCYCPPSLLSSLLPSGQVSTEGSMQKQASVTTLGGAAEAPSLWAWGSS